MIEEVTGMQFSEYMRQTILEPMGLKHSSFVRNPEIASQAAIPYGIFGKPFPRYIFTEQAVAGLYTDVVDLARFTAMCLPERRDDKTAILTSELLSQM